MASITIRNLGDDLKKRLRMQAAANGRSLEAEVRDILARTVQAAGRPQAKTGLDLFKPILDAVNKYGGVELEIPPRTPMRDVELGSIPPPLAGMKGKSFSKRGDTGAATVREARGNARISTLRETYGDNLATGARGDTKLQSLVRDASADFRHETHGKPSSRRKK